ncbi:hypothetical protein D3C87_2041360 [compost metagenome]
MVRLFALPSRSWRAAGSAGLLATVFMLVKKLVRPGAMPTVRSANRLLICETWSSCVCIWAPLPCAPTSCLYKKLS